MDVQQVSSSRIVDSRVFSMLESTSQRICKLKSPWFTWPQIIIKSGQLAFSVAVIIAFLQWESRGVTLFELHMKDETINYRDFFIFYLGVASITIVYSVVLSVVGFSGVTSPPPTVESLLSVVCLLLWVLSSSFISAVIETIDNSRYARYIDLNTLILHLGNGCGFIEIFVFTVEVCLSFTALKSPLEDQDDSDNKTISRDNSVTSTSHLSEAYLQGRAHKRQSLKKKLGIAQ